MESAIVIGSVIAGFTFVVVGVAMVSVPAAVVIAGIGLIGFGISYDIGDE